MRQPADNPPPPPPPPPSAPYPSGLAALVNEATRARRRSCVVSDIDVLRLMEFRSSISFTAFGEEYFVMLKSVLQ